MHLHQLACEQSIGAPGRHVPGYSQAQLPKLIIQGGLEGEPRLKGDS
jgi:hypothetical protein